MSEIVAVEEAQNFCNLRILESAESDDAHSLNDVVTTLKANCPSK